MAREERGEEDREKLRNESYGLSMKQTEKKY